MKIQIPSLALTFVTCDHSHVSWAIPRSSNCASCLTRCRTAHAALPASPLWRQRSVHPLPCIPFRASPSVHPLHPCIPCVSVPCIPCCSAPLRFRTDGGVRCERFGTRTPPCPRRCRSPPPPHPPRPPASGHDAPLGPAGSGRGRGAWAGLGSQGGGASRRPGARRREQAREKGFGCSFLSSACSLVAGSLVQLKRLPPPGRGPRGTDRRRYSCAFLVLAGKGPGRTARRRLAAACSAARRRGNKSRTKHAAGANREM